MEGFDKYKKINKEMIKSYIGYSNNPEIRFKATSGGIGSTVLKYLFDNNIINTSVSFKYDRKTLEYKPYLIYRYDDYEITGSIYHEINLIKFIKDNIKKIKGKFACFVLPCQAQAIRILLQKQGIDSFLIGLTCSSQQSIDATYYLLKRLNIKRTNVNKIQYRGNGWPSGIQIHLKNNKNIFVPNNNSLWTDIFHSRLFIQKRCFGCNNTLNIYSDISLADPWLQEYINEEKKGQTILICNSKYGYELICQIIDSNAIILKELDESLVIKSQNATIQRKNGYKKNNKWVYLLKKMHDSNLYKKLVLNNGFFLKLHNKLKKKIEQNIINK